MQKKSLLSGILTALIVTAGFGFLGRAQAMDEGANKTNTTKQKATPGAVSSPTVVQAVKNAKPAGNSKTSSYPVAFPQNERIHKNFEETQRGISGNLKSEMEKVSMHLPQVAHISARTGKNANPGYPSVSENMGASGVTGKETGKINK